jgi:hypothetical protein
MIPSSGSINACYKEDPKMNILGAQILANQLYL